MNCMGGIIAEHRVGCDRSQEQALTRRIPREKTIFVLTILRRFQGISIRHRVRTAGVWTCLVVLFVGVGALASLWLLGEAYLKPDTTEGLWERIEAWSFWCATIIALVCGYSTFECMYRDRLARRMATLPVEYEGQFWWMVTRLYGRHVPLLLLPLATGASLVWAGHPMGFLLGVATGSAVWVWGLAGAIFVHLWAGRSMLTGATSMKEYLAQGFGPPETAFLFYSPAMALTGCLAVSVLTDLAVRSGLMFHQWQPLIVVSAGCSAVAVVSLVRAHRLYVTSFHRIAPRFEEAEILPPWREGHLPRRYWGEGLSRLLPLSTQHLWLRNLRQYRRRFRVIVPLLVVTLGGLIVYGFRLQGIGDAPVRIGLVAAVIGALLFVPAFRLCGRDLRTRYDARALPVSSGQEMVVQWLMAAFEWLPLLLVTALSSWVAMGGSSVWMGVGVVVLAFVMTNGLAIPLAVRKAPDVTISSVLVRGVVLTLLGVATMGGTLWGVG
jgi:hypothetical protein